MLNVIDKRRHMEDPQEDHAKDQTEPKDEAEEQILDFTKPDFKFVPKEYH